MSNEWVWDRQAGDGIGHVLSRNHSTLWIVPSVSVTFQGCAEWCARAVSRSLFLLLLTDVPGQLCAANHFVHLCIDILSSLSRTFSKRKFSVARRLADKL